MAIFFVWKVFALNIRKVLWNINYMRGRILGVKKTYILRFLIVALFLLFTIFVFLNIFVIPYRTLWFYAFSFLLGIYEVSKSRLFKLDSGFYLGSLLIFIGISGFVFTLTKTDSYWCLYLLADFFIASFLTFLVCGQYFHLIFDFSLLFIIIFTSFYTFSLITLPIFIAFLVAFLVLFILIITFNFKH